MPILTEKRERPGPWRTENISAPTPKFPEPSAVRNGTGGLMFVGPFKAPNNVKKGTLSDEQLANIIFNETRSLSGIGIDTARKHIAHAIINGDEQLGSKRPATAPMEAKVPDVEKPVYQDILQNVSEVRKNRDAGLDPTNGAILFNFRNGDSVSDFQEYSISTQTGPFNNSYGRGGLNNTGIYSNTYRRSEK